MDDQIKPYGGIRRNERMLTRNVQNSFHKWDAKVTRQQVEFEDTIASNMIDWKDNILYEVEDVQKELEMLTENSKEIEEMTESQLEQLEIKRNIRVAFKRDSKAPAPNFKYYKIGRLIGRGSFGKVNLALHKLTRKLVAVKSVNKIIFENSNQEEPENEKLQQIIATKIKNEEQILLKLRHKNVIKLYESRQLET